MIEPNDISLTGQYSIQEAVKILGLSRKTLYNKINNGVLRCHYRKGSNQRFFVGRDLLCFLDVHPKKEKKFKIF